MVYLLSAGAAEYYCNNVKAVGAIFDVVASEEVACGFEYFVLLVSCNEGFCGSEGVICSCFYLNENNGSVLVDHNEVNFAGFAGVISCKEIEPFFSEEFFCLFFAPSAEQLLIIEQLAFL